MHTKLVKLHSLFIVGALTVASGAAHADNINTPGVMCQPVLGSQSADIDHLDNQVSNRNTEPRQVVCGIPRPSSITLPTRRFFVDGANSNNTSTTCIIAMYAFNGNFTQTLVFTESATTTTTRTWDHLVDLPVTGTSSFDYAYVRCTLPGSQHGAIFGVTAVP